MVIRRDVKVLRDEIGAIEFESTSQIVYASVEMLVNVLTTTMNAMLYAIVL